MVTSIGLDGFGNLGSFGSASGNLVGESTTVSARRRRGRQPPPIEGCLAQSPVSRALVLRPSGTRRRRLGGYHLSGAWPFEHGLRTAPFGRQHEQRSPVRASERAGEAAAVELDRRKVAGHHPSHVMVFDRTTRILFSGDTVYPGRLYFQCGRAEEYRASIDRVADFAATRQVRWLLGAHIEMKSAPGQSFQAEDRARCDEHLLELQPSVLEELQQSLLKMGKQVRVEPHDDFILFPHPADPRGKNPPDWCLGEAAST